MDALSSAASGMQSASWWLSAAASNIAASGVPDPVDAVAAYVEAPIAFAANARVFEAAADEMRTLIDALA